MTFSIFESKYCRNKNALKSLLQQFLFGKEMNWNLLFLFLSFAEASLNGPAKGSLTDDTKAGFNDPAEVNENDPVIEPESTLSSFVKRPKIDNGTCP